MKNNLSPYEGKILCVALSGGKDSMALLHYIKQHAQEYHITLCALHCNHAMRGESSQKDSVFVQQYCQSQGIPLLLYEAKEGQLTSEEQARSWRHSCFSVGGYPLIMNDGTKWLGYDVIATAHHLNDNVETILFRLARGTALAGVCGITQGKLYKVASGPEQTLLPFPVNAKCYDTSRPQGQGVIPLVHPLIDWSREEIDKYIEENHIPYTQDESNFSDDYTRNYIRHHVLPALEEAVPGATKAIHRFSRLCMDDEDYLSREADKLISQRNGCGYLIAPTKERVLLKRAAVHLIARCFGEKDYTAEQLEQLNNLQNAENGKRFEFLGLTAIKEPKGIALLKTEWLNTETEGMPFTQFSEGKCNLYAAQPFVVTTEKSWKEDVEKANISSSYKILKIDLADIPSDAVVRFMQKGDTFCKFGGGTKKLGDYFTDCKIPLSLRGHIPLVAQGHNVLLVGGVEISENVKLNNKTQEKNIRFIICRDYRSM